MNKRRVLDTATMPRLAPHVQFRFDEKRGRWVVLAPERLLVPDEIAVEVLKLCDGNSSVAAMVTTLAERYETSSERVGEDVLELLQDLADQGILAV